MKTIALIVSARERGNCHDFAQFMLKRIAPACTATELFHLLNYQITPCQNCNYECVQKFHPEKGVNAQCPIEDDVESVWKKIWNTQILIVCIPTYGGLPPASWIAFNQRQQGILEKAPKEKQKNFLVSAVVLASPQWSGIAERTPSIVADQIKNMGRQVVGFEVINNAGFETENLFGKLINEVEIQRRLEFLIDRILEAAKRNSL